MPNVLVVNAALAGEERRRSGGAGQRRPRTRPQRHGSRYGNGTVPAPDRGTGSREPRPGGDAAWRAPRSGRARRPPTCPAAFARWPCPLDNHRHAGASRTARRRRCAGRDHGQALLGLLPEVPTLAEGRPQGLRTSGTLSGVLAPAATPGEISARLSAEIIRPSHSSEFMKRMDEIGASRQPIGDTHNARLMARRIKDETDKFAGPRQALPTLPRSVRTSSDRPEPVEGPLRARGGLRLARTGSAHQRCRRSGSRR